MTDEVGLKKKRGAFYTPDAMAMVLAECVLEDFEPDIYFLKDSADAGSFKYGEKKLRILDPACGDGQLLISIVFCLKAKLSKWLGVSEAHKLKEIERQIINDFIYGADIDEKALTVLKKRFFEHFGAYPSNIINKDLLIEDGFGVDFSHIIGNPPYIGHKTLDNDYKKLLYKRYPNVYTDKTDILSCFFMRGLELLHDGGTLCFITSRFFLEAQTYKGLRIYLSKNSEVVEIIDYQDVNVFKEANVASAITLLKKKKPDINAAVKYFLFKDSPLKDNLLKDNTLKVTLLKDIFKKGEALKPILKKQNTLSEDGWVFPSDDEIDFVKKIESKSNYSLDEIFHSNQGIITGYDKAFVFSEIPEDWNENEKKLFYPWIKNSGIESYKILYRNIWIMYTDLIKPECLETEYPNVYNHLITYRKRLKKRREVLSGTRDWYKLQWGRVPGLFKQKKIVYPYKAKTNRFAIDEAGYFFSADVYSLIPKEGFEWCIYYVLALLNSKAYDRYFKTFAKKMGKGIYDYYPNKVLRIKVFIPQNKDDVMGIIKKSIELESLLRSTKNEDKSVDSLHEFDLSIHKHDLSISKLKDELEKEISQVLGL